MVAELPDVIKTELSRRAKWAFGGKAVAKRGGVPLDTSRKEKFYVQQAMTRAVNHADDTVADIARRVLRRWFETIDPLSATARASTGQDIQYGPLAVAMHATIHGKKAQFSYNREATAIWVRCDGAEAYFNNESGFADVDAFFAKLKLSS